MAAILASSSFFSSFSRMNSALAFSNAVSAASLSASARRFCSSTCDRECVGFSGNRRSQRTGCEERRRTKSNGSYLEQVALVDELLVTAGQLRTQLAQLPLVLPEQGALVRILVDHSLVLDVLGPGNAWQTARQTFGNRNSYVYGVRDGGAHPRDLRDMQCCLWWNPGVWKTASNAWRFCCKVTHLLANFKVDRLSAKASMAGLIMHIIVVLQLPPKLSSSMRVSLLSRYGMWARSCVA